MKRNTMKNKLFTLAIISFIAFDFFGQNYGPIVILPGYEGSNPRDFKQLGNLLIFTASDSPSYYPRKIFRSDGTTSGTYALKNDLSVQSNNSANIDDSAFIKAGNYLYFVGVQNGNGAIWRTDGSVNGTSMVFNGSTLRMVILNGDLYFLSSITDPIWGTTSTKLFKHQPSNNTTTEIYSWNNSSSLNGTSPLRVYNNKIYFYGWQSDGTTANTIQNNVNLPASSESCVYNGLIYYRGSDGKLWRTDGTTSGTYQAVNFPVWVNGIKVYDNLMYFAGGNVSAGLQGTELCNSDGTLSNTSVVHDIYYGYNSSYPSDFSIVNGSLYFLANDGIHGTEIYKSDGSTVGTFLLKDIKLGTESSFFSNFYPAGEQYNSKISHQNQLYFTYNDYSDNISSVTDYDGIWKSDGTTAGTINVFQIDTSRSLIDVNGKLFFAGYTQNEGWELYAEGLTANINEFKNQSSIFISPNPTSDIISVLIDNFQTNLNYKIFDQFGRILIQSTFDSKENQVDLSQFNSGIYFLKLDGESVCQKIIKN
jgi:ELWxxDGT repeat protein